MKKNKFNYQEIIMLSYVIYIMLNQTNYQFASLLPSITNMIINLSISVFMVVINIKKISIKKVYLVMLAMLFLTTGVLINNSGFGSLVTMINFYSLFLYGEHTRIGMNCIKIICVIIGVGGIVYFFSDTSVYNPNTVGYFYFMVAIFLCILIELVYENKKNIIIKFLKLVILIIAMYLIYKTEARASLLGMIAFLAFMQIDFLTQNKKIFKIITFIIIIGALLFPYIYVGMWNAGIQVNMGEGNKKFYTGRQKNWSETMYRFEGKELFGIGTNTDSLNNSLTENIHNSLFAIWTIYGNLNFIIFIGMFFNLIWNMQKNSLNKINRTAIAGIIGMIVVSYYETNLYVSIYFLILATITANLNSNKEEKIDKINDKFIMKYNSKLNYVLTGRK